MASQFNVVFDSVKQAKAETQKDELRVFLLAVEWVCSDKNSSGFSRCYFESGVDNTAYRSLGHNLGLSKYLVKSVDDKGKPKLDRLDNQGLKLKEGYAEAFNAAHLRLSVMVKDGLGLDAAVKLLKPVRPEKPKAEAPKAEAPKADAPKADAPKAVVAPAHQPTRKSTIADVVADVVAECELSGLDLNAVIKALQAQAKATKAA